MPWFGLVLASSGRFDLGNQDSVDNNRSVAWRLLGSGAWRLRWRLASMSTGALSPWRPSTSFHIHGMGSQGVVELGIGAHFAIPCADDREVACRNHGRLLDGPRQVGGGGAGRWLAGWSSTAGANFQKRCGIAASRMALLTQLIRSFFAVASHFDSLQAER